MGVSAIKVGVIGLGAVGERLIKIMQERDDIVLAAFCDTSEDRLAHMTETYKVNETYTDYEELLVMPEIDAVYVAVPPKYHEKIVLRAVETGKHILCEKPLANSVTEAKRMADAVNNSELVHAMHFPLNYQGGINRFEQLVQEGGYGEICRLNLKMHFPHWPRLWQQNDWVGKREQGGFVLEVGVHWIQLMQRVFGEITEVKSKLQFPEDPEACETGIIAEMKFADGAEVLIDGLSNIAGEEQLEFGVYGTEGTLMIRNWRELFAGKNGGALKPVNGEDTENKDLIGEFVKAVQGEPAQIYDFAAGYKAQVVLEALRDPAHDGWQKLEY